jgi:DNA invertase Pin-like site-specific DNA recombinase
MRTAIYARVSTEDQQSLSMQISVMKDYARRRGWELTKEVQEIGSGAQKRLQREKLLDLARRREIDSIIVWKLDRWGRSVADLVTSLNELREVGVGFVSITEALDLTTSSGRAMAGLLAVFAEFERDLIRERVRAGLDQARKKGKVLGRPQTAMSKAAEVLSLRRKSLSISEIARRTHIDRRSVRRIIERTANGALTP